MHQLVPLAPVFPGRGAGVRGNITASPHQSLEHFLRAQFNIVVRKSQDSKSVLFEPPLAPSIALLATHMGVPVEFYDQSAFGAVEVDAIRAQRMLAPKLVPGETTTAGPLPECVFRQR